MISTGLDRLLADPGCLAGRKYGVLAHAAAVSADRLEPSHLALLRAGAEAPSVLFGPEHGFWSVEQDMVSAQSAPDPLSGIPTLSLYRDTVESLRPSPTAFSNLDLLVIDLQDVGARYYTYAATAIWAAEAALGAGCEVWLLDRPNPLGGEVIEGNSRQAGYESFVGAFDLPVRHGLTMGELLALEARGGDWPAGWRIWCMEGWKRSMTWEDLGRPWIAPSPNIPTAETAWVYPGVCLVEATELSEGRGTTRPFQLIGAPGLEPAGWAEEMAAVGHPGVVCAPTYFRPQFQKHAGRVCGGLQITVTDRDRFRGYRFGAQLLSALRSVEPEALLWRSEAYEFVCDRPAIDLLTGGPEFREAVDDGHDLGAWLATWEASEDRFRKERREILLYPE